MRKYSNCPAAFFFPQASSILCSPVWLNWEGLVLSEIVVISGKYWNWGEHELESCSEGKSATWLWTKSGLVGLFFLLCHVKQPLSAWECWSHVPVGHWGSCQHCVVCLRCFIKGVLPLHGLGCLSGEFFMWGTEAQANAEFWSTQGLEKMGFVPL